MSYDCEIGTVFANKTIECFYIPTISNPTYNLRNIFCKAMDFEFTQGKWYPMKDMLGRFDRAIETIYADPASFRSLEPANRWGTVEGALECFKCWASESRDLLAEVPIENLYFRW